MSDIQLDRESLLVHVDASTSLLSLQAALARQGLTLDIAAIADQPVGDWLAEGAHGARSAWLDPCDHLVAGYVATIGGERVEVRPAPRRATGPDLFALLFGQHGRFGALHTVWLRVHLASEVRPVAAPFHDAEGSSEPSPEEEALAVSISLALEISR